MRFYDLGSAMNIGKDIADSLTEVLELETGKKIFTLRILEKHQETQSFEMLIVFEDKEVMLSTVTVPMVGNRLGVRLQGNFI